MLVVYPDQSNWFYADIAHRLKKALPHWVFLPVSQFLTHRMTTNDQIMVIHFGECHSKLNPAQVKQLKKGINAFPKRLLLLAEAFGSPWFLASFKMGVKWHKLIDFGYAVQDDAAHYIAKHFGAAYGLCRETFTQSEFNALTTHAERLIPWSFIGVETPERAVFACQLQSGLPENGLVLLPPLSINNALGLSQTQMDAILRQSKYYIWKTQHAKADYIESVRPYQALCAGAIPVRIGVFSQPLPFCYNQLQDFVQEYLVGNNAQSAFNACVNYYKTLGPLDAQMKSALAA